MLVYDIGGQRTFVIGGAYSVDKAYRLLHGLGWWPDEQPSEEIKRRVEENLDEAGWEVDVVLTHTAPLKYEPREVFLPGINQSMVDKSTEQWLDSIEDRLDYKKWYCGHYHTIKEIERVEFMFDNFDEFPQENDTDNHWDEFDVCAGCGEKGDDYYTDENGEQVCRCLECPLDPMKDDD